MAEQIYDVLDAAGAVINRIILEDAHAWSPPPGHTIRKTVPVVTVAPMAPFSKLAFLRRFTTAERIAIRAHDEPVTKDFLYLLDLAEEVDVRDQDTRAWVNYLETCGVLAPGRAAEILAA